MRNNRLPENPLAIFLCYKMLKKTKLSPLLNEPNYTLETNDPFSLPRLFKIPAQRKKQIKYLSANLKLNSFIKQIVFRSWKNSSLKTLHFKRKLDTKTASFYFKILKSYSDHKIINRFQLNKYLKSKNRELYSKFFTSWSFHANEKIALRSLLESYTKAKNRETLSNLFDHWETLSKDKRRIENSEMIVGNYIRRKYLQKYFQSLSSYYLKQRRVIFIVNSYLRFLMLQVSIEPN